MSDILYVDTTRPVLINKTITANGTYNAADDNADGYKSVIAEFSGGITLETLNVSTNGTTNAPSGKAYNKVVTNVPNSYAAGDEGKVVSGGALVAQTAHAQVTSNGVVDTTTNNSVEVAVPVPTLESKSINANGTYTPASGKAWNEVVVSVASSGVPYNSIDITLASSTSYADILNAYANSWKAYRIYPTDADNQNTNTYDMYGGNLFPSVVAPNGATYTGNLVGQHAVNDQTYDAIRIRANVNAKPAGNYKLEFYGEAKL